MKDVPEYLKSGLIDFNQGIYPDSKLTALHVGLENYYETYNITIGSFYDYFHETEKEMVLSELKGHSHLMKYYGSIIYFHLSFEQFIIEILQTISPYLPTLQLKKENDFINLLNDNTASINNTNKKNISYTTALKRVELLIKNREHLPPQYRVENKYDFILESATTLRTLYSLRNDIIHSGKQTLNRYLYEYFFANDVIPFTRKYLNTQKPTKLLERNLSCNKNVIDEICCTQLSLTYSDKTKYSALIKSLQRISHFKELGRASYKNPIHMLEDVQNDEGKMNIEMFVNKPLRDSANFIAKFRQEYLDHFKLYKCPCCGSYALTTYLYKTSFIDNRTKVVQAECARCTYKIDLNIGEPKEFGIMDEEIFIDVNARLY